MFDLLFLMQAQNFVFIIYFLYEYTLLALQKAAFISQKKISPWISPHKKLIKSILCLIS